MITSEKDTLFEQIEQVEEFAFDHRVAAVFDDMVQRSVPFYDEVQRMVTEIAVAVLRPNGVFVDVGCSTGTTLLNVAEQVPEPSVRLVGIEPSDAMLEKARKKLAPLGERAELRHASIQDFDGLEGASVVAMLYTLQFVRPIDRLDVVRMIYNSLPAGGYFLLAEKILADTDMARRMYIDLYHRYKKTKGYSDLEISRKRDALENVLVPFRHCENLHLLRQAGFSQVEEAFRWYNFALYIAVR